ncbi:response regulator transcription factor [Tabrizicola sp.]|uniref:helix-turn-helix transcriptional regulator n=1 Tax=Tabrizicola sp. TaxID=2005166 RepID=UPI003F39E5A6
MDKDLRLFGVDKLSVVHDTTSVLVICVGSRIQFPDCLCRLMESEVEGCSYLRLPTTADLAAAIAGGDLRPQLVIVDETSWPKMDGAVLNSLRLDLRSNIAIAFRDARRVIQMMGGRPGVPKGMSFLPMDLNIESWLTIVRLMLTGYPFVPSELLLATELAPQPDTAEAPAGAPANLTPRECEVMALVAKGFQNKHIAERLFLSEHTVKLHLHHAISKLGARNRTDAALRYRQHEGA